jgi:hypothetical protein
MIKMTQKKQSAHISADRPGSLNNTEDSQLTAQNNTKNTTPSQESPKSAGKADISNAKTEIMDSGAAFNSAKTELMDSGVSFNSAKTELMDSGISFNTAKTEILDSKSFAAQKEKNCKNDALHKQGIVIGNPSETDDINMAKTFVSNGSRADFDHFGTMGGSDIITPDNHCSETISEAASAIDKNKKVKEKKGNRQENRQSITIGEEDNFPENFEGKTLLDDGSGFSFKKPEKEIIQDQPQNSMEDFGGKTLLDDGSDFGIDTFNKNDFEGKTLLDDGSKK